MNTDAHSPSRPGPQSPAELTRAKARLRWQMLELYDMPTELAAFVGQGVLNGVLATPDARVDELMAVTRERVRDAAARIFQAKGSSLVVIGKLDAKARAALHGRCFVTSDDVAAVAKPVLRHRIITNFTAEGDGVTPDSIVDALLAAAPLDQPDTA